MLIDFGVLIGTEGAKEKMRNVARQIVEATGGRLDVLVATHEHWDHVSGFAQAADLLGPDQLEVDEVWLSWTENPGDSLAMDLDKRRKRALERVGAAVRRLSGASEMGAKRNAERMSHVLEFWGGLDAVGRATTRSALDWVRSRTDPIPPDWLEPGMAPLPVPCIDDVRVYVLGPPRDPKWLKKSDPSKTASEVYELGAETDADHGFFSAIDALADSAMPESQPFDRWFRVVSDEAKGRAFFQNHYGFEGEDWRRIEHDWLGLAGRLALQLDSDTNNTSLVLAFELGKPGEGRVLLFPGDAQVGNWLSWHETIEWEIEQKGKPKKVTARDLLERTVLYKVGHHGSHNATLRDMGLQMMISDELTAMLPVDRNTAKAMGWDQKMPFPALMQHLEERSRGRILDLEKGISKQPPQGTSEREWERFQTHAKVTDAWIDWHIEI